MLQENPFPEYHTFSNKTLLLPSTSEGRANVWKTGAERGVRPQGSIWCGSKSGRGRVRWKKHQGLRLFLPPSLILHLPEGQREHS